MRLLRHAIRHAIVSCNASTRSISTSNFPKPFYITTPIFYPNASPHIGHLYSLVTADVFARYQRRRGREVRFLAGTDEHGIKIQKAAQKFFEGERGKEQEFCDMLSERFRNLGSKANISNTCFMRTTSEEHRRSVEDVWRQLYAKGFIYKGNYSGWYSVTDEAFYTDLQVISSPTTGMEERWISQETGSVVERVSEENYMFRLSAFRDALEAHYTSRADTVYPSQYRELVLGMLNESTGPLEDISISRPRRRLHWGIPVPDDEEQTVYVWFDALLVYLTGAGYPWRSAGEMQSGGWPADVQVIGKDILRFHAIYLPAILLALSSPPVSSTAESSSTAVQMVPLARTLLTHAHWTSSAKKMSKSLGNVADPLAAMDKYGVDVVRFYLMRIGGRWRSDVDWSDQQLDKHFKEIQAQLGNYFLRITSPRVTERAIPSSPDVHEGLPEDLQSLFIAQDDVTGQDSTPETKEGLDPNYELLKLTLALPNAVVSHMDTYEAGLALGEIMNVLKVANKTLTDISPWLASASPSTVHTTRIVALETIRVAGACLAPFMPEISDKIGAVLGGQDALAEANQSNSGSGRQQMEEFWERWNKDIKGVKLF